MFMVKKTVSLLLGSILIGIGINGFLVPFHLVDGGLIGISLLGKYVWGLHVGVTIILLSVPIYWIAWIYFRSYFFNSLHGLILSSFSIDVFTPLKHMFEFPPIISAITGGLLIGTGVGLMLRYKTSTGGVDLLAQFISLKTSMNVGVIIFAIDGLVVILASQVISESALLYSAIAITTIGLSTTFWTFSFRISE